ncbi:hypothetical protein EW145_g6840, partial [Phellinidium pouzarii]
MASSQHSTNTNAGMHPTNAQTGGPGALGAQQNNPGPVTRTGNNTAADHSNTGQHPPPPVHPARATNTNNANTTAAGGVPTGGN